MWVLVAVALGANGVAAQAIGVFSELNQCFEVREQIMKKAPQPKMNYETVCVRTDLFN